MELQRKWQLNARLCARRRDSSWFDDVVGSPQRLDHLGSCNHELTYAKQAAVTSLSDLDLQMLPCSAGSLTYWGDKTNGICGSHELNAKRLH